jgi:Na+/H+ antiporter 1
MVGPPPGRRLSRQGERMSSHSASGTNPPPSSPPEAWEPLLRFARLAGRPLERFLRIEAASGILLLVAAAVALVWANSPWAESYVRLWHTPLGIRIGSFTFERTLEWFVNDGLMVIFFFVVGVEIRREIHHGELSELASRRASRSCGAGRHASSSGPLPRHRRCSRNPLGMGRADGDRHRFRGRHPHPARQARTGRPPRPAARARGHR